jgi:glycosyltransferase involved in cell wall biosynthesis
VKNLSGRRVVHVTTTDISLALLLGPQLRAFAEAGMEVIGASAPGPWVADLESWGIRHQPLLHATRAVAPGQDALALSELVRLFRRLEPDIVHTHTPKAGLYGRVAARLARVPVVVNTVHGLYAASSDPLLRRVAVYGLERLATTCSDAEFVQNPEDLSVLGRLGVPARKLTLLGNGVDLERFHPRTPEVAVSARRLLGVGDDRVVVGIVSRLVWEKGFRELFGAARILKERRPEVVMVVVGPRDQSKSDGLRDEDVAEAQQLGNVVIAGERRDVELIYPAFDIYVLPSYREGFPRSAMEAAACAIPVVATDIRGCRQVVEHGVTGVLVPVRDAPALAEAVEALVADPVHRGEMGRAGHEKALRDFDDRRLVELTLEVYSRLVEDRSRSRGPKGPPSPGIPS